MRMQLKHTTLLLSLFFPFFAWAQNEEKIDVNFLYNYYRQEGNHAAVTGGEGTEELDNHAPTVIINIPMDKDRSLNINAGVDYYSSASTDNIDDARSSASSSDIRSHTQLYFKKKLNNKQAFGLKMGASSEFDYVSTSFGVSWDQKFNNNQELNVQASVFLDRWTLILPFELRNEETEALLDTDKRRSYSLSASYSFVINQNMHAALIGDLIYQDGLLSTPFHRVYFSDIEEHSIEILPGNRLKTPIGIRVNNFISDALISRFFYRFYRDDFGVNAHTVSLELPISVSNFLQISPFGRYHTQTASDYFAAHGVHLSTDEFYSSDYDLSAFNSQQFGFALRYKPLFEMSKFKFFSKERYFRSIDLRVSRYLRSDGLKSYSFTFNFGFEF